MSLEKRFIQRLKEMQIKHAIEALQKPKDKSEFGYGEAHGVLVGLKHAEQLFEETIGEDDDRN